MHPDLQPPIIVVDDSGYAELYSTIEAAMCDLEGVDVADGLYQVFDAVGRRITLRAEGVQCGRWSIDIGTVRFDHADAEPTGAEQLRQLLIEHLATLKVNCGPQTSLTSAVQLVEQRHCR